MNFTFVNRGSRTAVIIQSLKSYFLVSIKYCGTGLYGHQSVRISEKCLLSVLTGVSIKRAHAQFSTKRDRTYENDDVLSGITQKKTYDIGFPSGKTKLSVMSG